MYCVMSDSGVGGSAHRPCLEVRESLLTQRLSQLAVKLPRTHPEIFKMLVCLPDCLDPGAEDQHGRRLPPVDFVRPPENRLEQGNKVVDLRLVGAHAHYLLDRL